VTSNAFYRLDLASGVQTQLLGGFLRADLSLLPSGTQALLGADTNDISGGLLRVDLTAISQFAWINQQLGATGVAAEANGTTALVTIGNRLDRVDLATGNVTAIAQGPNSPVGLAIEDSGTSVLVGSLFGISRINRSDGTVTSLSTTSARYLSVEPGLGTAVLAVAATGLSRLDLTTAVVTPLATGIHVAGTVAIEPGGSTALVATDNDGIVRVRIRSTAPPPSFSLVSPTAGTQGQIIPNFTVIGTTFDSNATLSFSGTGTAVSAPLT